jgi:hypothetical protein
LSASANDFSSASSTLGPLRRGLVDWIDRAPAALANFAPSMNFSTSAARLAGSALGLPPERQAKVSLAFASSALSAAGFSKSFRMASRSWIPP